MTRRSPATSDAALVVAVLGISVAEFLFGQRIEVNDGCGWDGTVYAEIAQKFNRMIATKSIDRYYIQRIVPSAIVHYSLRFVSVPLTKPNIVKAFGLLNIGLLALTGLAWCRVAEELKLGSRGKWLGAAGLFLNFCVLKWFVYYSVLTDVPAFALGMFMLYSYLARRPFLLAGLTALGAFVWPVLIYQGVLLMAFPRKADARQQPGPDRRQLHVLAASAVAVAVSTFMLYSFWSGELLTRSKWIREVIDGLNLHRSMNIVSLVCTGVLSAYLFLALSALWNSNELFSPACWLKSVSWRGSLTAILLVLGIGQLVNLLTTRKSPFGILDFIQLCLWEAVNRPGISYLAHVVFFGPIILLALLWWGRICKEIQAVGFGLTLCATFNLCLSIDSESRHLLHFFPILVPFVIKAAEVPLWSAGHCWMFLALCLGFSKVWLTLPGQPGGDASPQRFPAQWLNMNCGPWMSRDMYIVQGITALFICGLLYTIVVRPLGATRVGDAPR